MDTRTNQMPEAPCLAESALDCGGKRGATPLFPQTGTEANEENEGRPLRSLCLLLWITPVEKRRRRWALPAQPKTWRLLVAAILLSTLNAQRPTLLAQGTAFTYQGRLNDNGAPATGIYDLRFTIYDLASGGNAVAGPVTNSATGVGNGLFVAMLDFGANVFNGAPRWLEIGVRTNGSVMNFSTLSPRQALTATPYAIKATSADLAGTAQVANALPAGAVTTAMLATGAVGSNQLAAGAVTTAALAEGSVTVAKVATVSDWFALTIANPAPADSDFFGWAVAGVGSDRMLVGASVTLDSGEQWVAADDCGDARDSAGSVSSR